ncbi:glycosyltransferase [Patescibacteria group bacterium]|nr:glycosyltransferase [Patescibacteria group bacterium]
MLDHPIKLVVGFITYGELTAKYLPFFLNSLFANLNELSNNFKVLAIDNSEQQNNQNIRYIKNNYSQISIEWAGKNIGFARAYNKMIKKSIDLNAEYFLMFNPDIIIEKKAVKELIKAMDDDSKVEAISPKVLKWNFENNKKTNIIDTCGIQLKSGLRFVDSCQGQDDVGQFNNLEILGPSGTAGIYRISALEKIKQNNQYFDELMFMYKEDCDLVYRLFLNGFKSKCVTEAIIYHDRTVAAKGNSNLLIALNRRNKSKQEKKWAFLNQHIIFVKYWHLQNFWNKLAIIWYEIKILIFVLLFERYLLKQFWKLRKMLVYKVIKLKVIKSK